MKLHRKRERDVRPTSLPEGEDYGAVHAIGDRPADLPENASAESAGPAAMAEARADASPSADPAAGGAQSAAGDRRSVDAQRSSFAADPIELMGSGWTPEAPISRPTESTTNREPARPPQDANWHFFGSNEIVGRVRALNRRSEQDSLNKTVEVFSFRVDSYDQHGRRVPVAVEMRGRAFAGPLNEGDEVRISGRPRFGSILKINSLYNQTARGSFRSKGAPWSDTLLKLMSIPGMVIYVIIWTAFCVGFFALLFAILRDLT
jgi:hypothetical protein